MDARTYTYPSKGRAKMLHWAEAQVGTLAFLKYQYIPKDSTFWHSGQHVHIGGMHNHPVVILGVQGHLVTCATITSFGGKTIQAKYPNPCNVMLNHYMAINKSNTTEPHTNLPVLNLCNGQNLAKQSYVKLDDFFQIEPIYMESFQSGRFCLDPVSLINLQGAFCDFITERVPRMPAAPGRPRSPLEDRKYSNPAYELGVPYPFSFYTISPMTAIPTVSYSPSPSPSPPLSPLSPPHLLVYPMAFQGTQCGTQLPTNKQQAMNCNWRQSQVY